MTVVGQWNAQSKVAPCVGAWIEIRKIFLFSIAVQTVAPCVGAWIEI